MTNPMQFPDGFVFGGATAAYQVEGETRTHGKGKVPWDDFLAAQGRFSPDPASDFYNKYPVDIDLCQRFGINGIRVSIAWSRIFPRGTGEINPEGVAFYHELVATCNKAGVTPYVTLDHFDTPEAFYQNGGEGFLTRTTIDAFVEYAKFCFAEFTEVKHWFTFNEIPATAEGSFIVGNWPHGEKYRLDKAFQLMHNMMVAHAKAVVAFHEGGFEGEIGIVQNLEPKYPLDPNNAADCEAARMADVINNRWVLDATFRGHYAADTMEAATKLAHIAGGELDVRDEDIAALTAALPYNDCLGVNTYKCQFLRAAEGENDINHNGTGDKGSSRAWASHACAKAYPPPIGTGLSIPRACTICCCALRTITPTTRRSTSPRTAWAIRTTLRTALSTTPLASTTCVSISHGSSRQSMAA